MIDQGPNILVTSMWRSGSTHIAYGLGDILKFRTASMVGLHGEGLDEQVINMFTASILLPYGFQVFHQHTLATPRTNGILMSYRITPIVVVRNVSDCIVSIKDRLDLLWPDVNIPGLIVNPSWENFSEAQKYLWLAHNATPWLLKFYVSWKISEVKHLFVHYEKFYANQQEGFKQILRFLEVPKYDMAEVRAVERKKLRNNFNKGVSGRGKYLDAEILSAIDESAKSWGDFWYSQFKKDAIL